MDISYNKYCSEQLRLISDFDKIQEIFEIVLKNLYHLNSYLNKINNIFTYGIGNEYENQLVPDNSIDFIFSFSTLHWVPILSEYKSFEGSLYIPITDFGGIFSCNILIQEDQGSENEEKSKSIYYSMIKVKNILREMSYESILSRKEVEMNINIQLTNQQIILV
ncbi:hypothetical protein DDB_G0291582 [Dictyostelium discoideum AX4]|uniref:Uncharacterized protein n=1 Tax=Dictyostelium discoideum TaxID=44689 RepID=Q54EC6_DICDI|nr:hypothetical protein DDB_G0291582 [Dictyostelium discoideum AX4]EAL61775.1 hypothetical protein DDB_G0291582 [Dictyostelium discoideum AX4]|eukprot:XP_635314.1 hypothetical protein DDB_G0291582 [Dictyostelium discoideum AX4]